MSAPASAHNSNEKYKMAIVIRKDLKWTVQTVTVMCATACLALFKKNYKAREAWLSIWVSKMQRDGMGACVFLMLKL
jgi:peptidyl-tRNA hydrolase